LDLEFYFSIVSGKDGKMKTRGTEPKVGKMGGLHDFIYRLDRETLTSWAYAAERYYRKVNNLHLFGGVHDRIRGMTNMDIVEYVLEKANELPELDSKSKLDELALEYGFVKKNESLNFLDEEKEGGLHDYIILLPRSSLNRWAISAQLYHREELKEELDGGLMDYVGTLSDEDVIAFILKEAEEHKKINGQFLDELVVKYGLTDWEPRISRVHKKIGGLHDYIFRTDKDTLQKWALTCEKHHILVEGHEFFVGGHDYIQNMKDNEIAEFILKEVKEHKELDSKEALDNYARIYGFSN